MGRHRESHSNLLQERPSLVDRLLQGLRLRHTVMDLSEQDRGVTGDTPTTESDQILQFHLLTIICFHPSNQVGLMVHSRMELQVRT